MAFDGTSIYVTEHAQHVFKFMADLGFKSHS